MITHLLIDSFLFWSFLFLLIATSIYITKTAKKIFEYEQRVDRSWDDLMNRADSMIKRLNTILDEVQSLKESQTKKTRTRKISENKEEI